MKMTVGVKIPSRDRLFVSLNCFSSFSVTLAVNDLKAVIFLVVSFMVLKLNDGKSVT